MKDTEQIALDLIDEEDGRPKRKKTFWERLTAPAVIIEDKT